VSELAPLKVHAVSLPEGLPRKLHQIGQEPQQQTVSYQNVEFCSSWGTNTAPPLAVAVCRDTNDEAALKTCGKHAAAQQ